MTRGGATIDRVFQGLSNPTRRQVVERLSRGPGSVTELADPFAMALPSFLQHLRVLEDSGLVESEKHGRIRVYRLAPRPLRAAEHWLGRQRTAWEERLGRLDRYLLDVKEGT
jgi:DNA-binding transcriptional ArsR family regulator